MLRIFKIHNGADDNENEDVEQGVEKGLFRHSKRPRHTSDCSVSELRILSDAPGILVAVVLAKERERRTADVSWQEGYCESG